MKTDPPSQDDFEVTTQDGKVLAQVKVAKTKKNRIRVRLHCHSKNWAKLLQHLFTNYLDIHRKSLLQFKSSTFTILEYQVEIKSSHFNIKLGCNIGLEMFIRLV